MPPTLLRRYAPVLFFFGGFAWDALTLGRAIRSADLWILLGYLLGAAGIIVAIGRGASFRGSQYLNAALQFFFGGIFSALLIFYFLSSSSMPAYLVVFALGALLVGNEFLEGAYRVLTLSWAFFTLSAIMFFNFALAHLFRSISIFWFYAGTVVALLLVVALWGVSKRESASILPSAGVAAAMIVLHLVNAIPPVPLVKKQMFIAHDVSRGAEGYRMRVEPPGWKFWRASSATFHREGVERVFCFTSVFVPLGIETTIRHRWETRLPGRGWVTTGIIPFRIAGGREGGYRGYTYKENLSPGRWRVTAESESGAALGITDFDVVAGTPPVTKALRF